MEEGKSRANSSVTHVAQAGDSLQSITKSVANINGMNMGVASASEQQRTTTAGSEMLSLTARLETLVKQFRV